MENVGTETAAALVANSYDDSSIPIPQAEIVAAVSENSQDDANDKVSPGQLSENEQSKELGINEAKNAISNGEAYGNREVASEHSRDAHERGRSGEEGEDTTVANNWEMLAAYQEHAVSEEYAHASTEQWQVSSTDQAHGTSMGNEGRHDLLSSEADSPHRKENNEEGHPSRLENPKSDVVSNGFSSEETPKVEPLDYGNRSSIEPNALPEPEIPKYSGATTPAEQSAISDDGTNTSPSESENTGTLTSTDKVLRPSSIQTSPTVETVCPDDAAVAPVVGTGTETSTLASQPTETSFIVETSANRKLDNVETATRTVDASVTTTGEASKDEGVETSSTAQTVSHPASVAIDFRRSDETTSALAVQPTETTVIVENSSSKNRENIESAKATLNASVMTQEYLKRPTTMHSMNNSETMDKSKPLSRPTSEPKIECKSQSPRAIVGTVSFRYPKRSGGSRNKLTRGKANELAIQSDESVMPREIVRGTTHVSAITNETRNVTCETEEERIRRRHHHIVKDVNEHDQSIEEQNRIDFSMIKEGGSASASGRNTLKSVRSPVKLNRWDEVAHFSGNGEKNKSPRTWREHWKLCCETEPLGNENDQTKRLNLAEYRTYDDLAYKYYGHWMKLVSPEYLEKKCKEDIAADDADFSARMRRSSSNRSLKKSNSNRSLKKPPSKSSMNRSDSRSSVSSKESPSKRRGRSSSNLTINTSPDEKLDLSKYRDWAVSPKPRLEYVIHQAASTKSPHK